MPSTKVQDTYSKETVAELAVLFDIRTTVMSQLNVTDFKHDNRMMNYLNNRINDLQQTL